MQLRGIRILHNGLPEVGECLLIFQVIEVVESLVDQGLLGGKGASHCHPRHRGHNRMPHLTILATSAELPQRPAGMRRHVGIAAGCQPLERGAVPFRLAIAHGDRDVS